MRFTYKSSVLFTALIAAFNTFLPAPATAAENACGTVKLDVSEISAANETACDLTGILLQIDNLHTIEIPGEGFGVALSDVRSGVEGTSSETIVMHGLNGDIAVLIDASLFGSAQVVSEFDATPQPLVAAAPISGCGNTDYALNGYRWLSWNYSWWYNAAGQAVSGLTRIKAGIEAMASGLTRCGTTVSNKAVATYNGATNVAPNVSAAGCAYSNDGKSVVGWTQIGSNVLARTCVSFIAGAIMDADIAFDYTDSWYNSSSLTGCSGAIFDLQSVATHEAGHAFGLAHVAQASGQAMRPTSNYCDTAARKLGAGDALGMQVVYG